MHPPRTAKTSDRLLCALALLCFMVQQLWAPMHCLLHEHEIGGLGLAQVGVEHCPTHAGHDHFHGDEIIEAGDEDPDHEPHPIEDHLARVVEKLVPRASCGFKIFSCDGLERASVVWTHVDLPSVGMPWYQVHPAHGPPDLHEPAPRGPPAIV